ncbi:glycosyltransferase [Clostridium perfringens]|uniref:glycosyltransferase n=1 Tax=Clostridium perfringens TaxID=1502 RepID=UPI0022470062|nr:glycosyltransferase [Clostridium perfringens]MCX0373506.1 glycosyltransferase [Clostridium perfringens]
MKQYIFLTGKYLPTPGATGLCIHSIAKELVSEKNKVTTICYEDKSNLNNIDGVNIVRISAPSYFFDKKYKYSIKRSIDIMKSRLSKLIHINKYPLRSTRLMYNFKNTCLNLIGESDEATIIASYVPLEAVAALELIKIEKPKVKIIYYSADTLSNEQGNDGLLTSKKREQLGYKWEKRIFNKCDKILIMECHKFHYFSEKYLEYKNKMELVNFPLLNKPEFNVSRKDTNISVKNIVYAGTFYRNLRNPQFALGTLLSVLENNSYNLIIMGGGDCNDIVEEACNKLPNQIKFLGMQPHKIANEYISSASVLLSIGNSESPMAPSKIYEYMATGKPIIHFYSWDKDPCIETLIRYKNALIVKEGSINAKDRIEEFIKNSKTINFDDLEAEFKTSTPRYTASIIEKV